MNEHNETTDIFYKKAKLFLDKEQAVHCSLKNGRWLNGHILELSSDFFILNEFKMGETPVFFVELIDISRYIQAGGAP